MCRSEDGVEWTLVTPGCRAPQSQLVARGYKQKNGQRGYGTAALACNPKDPNACYGDEYCDEALKTCKLVPALQISR